MADMASAWQGPAASAIPAASSPSSSSVNPKPCGLLPQRHRSSAALLAVSLTMALGAPAGGAAATGTGAGLDPPFLLDAARVLSVSKAGEVEEQLEDLQQRSGWRVRVVTRTEPTPATSGQTLRTLWSPDERTIVVIEDLTAPNILNFNVGPAVNSLLPRQFFVELQSRYGNQFFVAQEGESAALLFTLAALNDCLLRPAGCRFVPGLTDDLYFLTLATSIFAGCVFGFAARIPPSGRIGASWQWVLLFAPLWLLLLGSFSILPIVGRTAEVEPLVKNLAAFLAAASALYWTPILGSPPRGDQS